MRLKSLLLGSAAAVMVAGGAQAADLSIGAEPVDYVRVCDAFGVGYWYIPGTDTCIKIGGEVNFSARFRDGGWKTGAQQYLNLYPLAFNDTGGHSSHFRFQTEASVNFTAKSMTEYGALVGYVKLLGTRGTYSATSGAHIPGDQGVVKIDEAYLSLGHVLFGYTGSAANWDEGYAPGAWRGDTKANQIKLSWAAAGFGLQLGIEDPIGRWGTGISGTVNIDDEFGPLDIYWQDAGSYHVPDITGNITLNQGHWNAKIVAGYTHQVLDFGGYDGGGIPSPTYSGGYTSVYGVAGTLEAVMGDFKLRGGAGFGTGTSYLGLGGRGFNNGDQMWTAYLSGLYQLTSTFSAAATYAIAGSNNPVIDGVHLTAFGGKLVWAPVAGFEAYADGKLWKYSDVDDHTWEWKVGAKRYW